MAKRKWSSGAAAVLPLADGLPATHVPRSRRSTTGLQSGHVARHVLKPPHRQPCRGGHSASANPNVHADVLDQITAPRASPDGGDNAELSGLKPRASKSSHTGQGTTDAGADAGPSETHATAGVVAAPASRDEHGYDGRNGGTTLGGGATNNARNELGPPSETAAADLPTQQPNRSEKCPRHVKVGCAKINSYALNGTEADVTQKPPGRDAAGEGNVGVLIDSKDENGPNAKDEDEGEHEHEQPVKEALLRTPPVNSDILPLPWNGRLGYACLNTYLRNANPPVFCSRTCRIASILEHRHPLRDPSQPEHPTKNRPDKSKPADVARGRRYVEELGLANARDMIKVLRWNDRYGIKFVRLSSDMFPFASHEEYGYKLEPFAGETLQEVGKVVATLGHRVTTHPGQFTQLGSPREEVITAAIRDLEFHSELLSLLKLPPQQDRDAVMILHLGGGFGDKPATLDRFRKNYGKLSQAIKNRLVLENDDVIWSVHDLLPLCQELNIPFVLDFHHHNIIFDPDKIRGGTKDIIGLFPAIIETWQRKGITPKMHYSEPCPSAVSGRDRRKHSPRVMSMPPCPNTMDLMIEAKDKEQAVFELMRTFKLPGFDLFNDMIPHIRQDENRPVIPSPKKADKKGKKGNKKKNQAEANDLDDLAMKIEEAEEAEAQEQPPELVPEEEVGMGGPQGRVYWPPGMEDWLRPPKRIIKNRDDSAATAAKKKKRKSAAADAAQDGVVNGVFETKTPATKTVPKKAATRTEKKAPEAAPAPSPSENEDDSPLSDLGNEDTAVAKKRDAATARVSSRPSRAGRGRVSYQEDADAMELAW